MFRYGLGVLLLTLLWSVLCILCSSLDLPDDLATVFQNMKGKHVVLFACDFSYQNWGHDYYSRDIFRPDKYIIVKFAEFAEIRRQILGVSLIDAYNANRTEYLNYVESASSKSEEVKQQLEVIYPRVIAYNIENSGDNADYPLIKTLVDVYSPTVLFHTSDEFRNDRGRRWKYSMGTEFYRRHYGIPLILREYSVNWYRQQQEPCTNVVQLPLGYMTGMFDSGNITVAEKDEDKIDKGGGAEKASKLHEEKKRKRKLNTFYVSKENNAKNFKPKYANITEASIANMQRTSIMRNTSWSFIGNTHGHHDRQKLLKEFESDWSGGHVGGPAVGSFVSLQEMAEFYQNSRFVLAFRGQVTMDTFRLYEAIIAGALPILICDDNEFNLTFEFEGNHPPVLHFNNVFNALAVCRAMSDDEIDRRRKEQTLWFIRRIAYINAKLDWILEVDAYKPNVVRPDDADPIEDE